MSVMGKIFIFIGLIFLIIGAGIYFLGRIPGIGKLPGDVIIKKENFTFYFPMTTCIVISLLLSFIFFLWQRR